jgi:RNA polymerase sigma-70 factor (ECF subfamily)
MTATSRQAHLWFSCTMPAERPDAGRRRAASERVSESSGSGVSPGQDAFADLADLDEPGLVTACVDGRPMAFDLLVERHRRSVYQLCYRFVGNHEDASELAQDVFVRAFRALDRFKGQSSIATWLYRIGVNVCLNRVSVKRPRLEPLDEQFPLEHPGESASDRVLREERAVRVRRAIAQLPEKQRAALILRMYHDLSHQQIAESLGGTEGAAKANVFHAIKRLREVLRGEGL